MKSELQQSKKQLYFFPATGAVLTNTNYVEIAGVINELKAIARSARAGRGHQLSNAVKADLMRKYRRYLAGIAKGASPRQRAQIQSFERQLMVVMSGTTVASVLNVQGIRPFHGKERVWSVLPGAPITLPEKF